MEEWRDIKDFPGYQVSNQGRVRTFWRRKHYATGYGSYNYISDIPRIMSASDDGNGYLKLMLYSKTDGKRHCKKIHRLVAEAFIPCNIDGDVTVDHILSGSLGKLDNSVNNLRWMSRRENIQKAYREGMCDERIARQAVPIMAFDIWTGKEFYFYSIADAARALRLDATGISHVLSGRISRTSHYTFEYAGEEERLLYGNDEYESYQLFSWV